MVTPQGTGTGAGTGAAADAAPVATVTALVATTCPAGSPRGGFNPYDEQRALQGDDGVVHTDSCDARGNLVSYQCEEVHVRCPNGGRRGGRHNRHMEAPCLERTGRVKADTVDCDGQCRAGACNKRCPQFGDKLTYLRIDADGNSVFVNASDPRRIACSMVFDQKKDNFDCKTGPKVGDVITVEGLGMSTTMCTGGTWGNLGTRRCSYGGCRFVYD